MYYMFGCSFQRGVEPKRRLFDLLHDVMCWWLVPFIQMRWIFYDDGELSSCLTTRWMGVKEKKVSYSRRTCCFYLLLNTWFVFCFPRVCICMCYPKKGKFLRLGYGHIATITTSRESIYLVWRMFEESFDVCVMMSFWCRCFCFLIDVALWIIYSKTLWRIKHFYWKGLF